MLLAEMWHTLPTYTPEPFVSIPHPPGPACDQRYYGNTTHTAMRTGQIACAISHLTLLEHFIAYGQPAAMIFEDDAQLDPSFVRR